MQADSYVAEPKSTYSSISSSWIHKIIHSCEPLGRDRTKRRFVNLKFDIINPIIILEHSNILTDGSATELVSSAQPTLRNTRLCDIVWCHQVINPVALHNSNELNQVCYALNRLAEFVDKTLLKREVAPASSPQRETFPHCSRLHVNTQMATTRTSTTVVTGEAPARASNQQPNASIDQRRSSLFDEWGLFGR